MIERWYDFYGCCATIIRKRNQTFDLYIRTKSGKLIIRKNYGSYHGARIAMGKSSDCWHKA